MCPFTSQKFGKLRFPLILQKFYDIIYIERIKGAKLPLKKIRKEIKRTIVRLKVTLIMNKYDFNDLEAMLRNGASDEEIAEAFSENLNLARAAEAKRKAEEEKKAAAEAAKAEDARLHRQEAMRLATNAAIALNALLIHEGILREGEMCFSAEDLLDTIDEARKETASVHSLIDSLISLGDALGLGREAPRSPKTDTCRKDISPTKKVPSSDEDIFNELFSKIFK